MGRGIASSTHLSSFFLLLCGVTAANTQCTPPAMHRSQLEPLTGMHLSFFFLHSLLQTWSSSSASTGLFLAREGRRPPWPGCLSGRHTRLRRGQTVKRTMPPTYTCLASAWERPLTTDWAAQVASGAPRRPSGCSRATSCLPYRRAVSFPERSSAAWWHFRVGKKQR